MDRKILDAISMAIERGMTRRMEMYEEVWLTGEQLCEKFGMISKWWLEKYGYRLPRERMEVMDETGKVLASRWGYPYHRINRWMQEERGHVSIMVKGGEE